MSKRITLFVAAALVLSIAGLAGCSQTPKAAPSSTSTAPVSQFATQQPSVEPTESAEIDASGPITTPAAGSATRKLLLAAARQGLSTSTEFYVNQLFVQGDTALGDLDPVTKTAGKRVLVAWEHRDGAWSTIAISTFGLANAAETARALPSFSDELISKINWALAPLSSTATSTADSSSMKTSLSAAAKKWAAKAMDGQGKPYQIAIIKVAKDAKGVWWGRAVVAPTGGFERLEFWAKYSSGSWSGKVQDPEPPAPSTYFPSAVISKLGL